MESTNRDRKAVRRLGLSVALAGIAALGACGSQSPQLESLRQKSHTAPPATDRQKALAEAERILALLRLPGRATRYMHLPPGAGSRLSQPEAVPGTPDLVDVNGWWVMPRAPQPIIGWFRDHLPAGSTTESSGTQGDEQGTEGWFLAYQWSGRKGDVDSRILTVEAVSFGRGETAIRADAQVTWIPARPTSEVVPAGARYLTITLNGPLGPGGRARAFVVTSPEKISKIEVAFDALPPYPPGVFHCPADFGSSMELVFRVSKTSPVLAVLTASETGCQEVDVVTGGHREPGFASGGPFVEQVASIVGIPKTDFAPSLP